MSRLTGVIFLTVLTIPLAGCRSALPPEQAREVMQQVGLARRTTVVRGQVSTAIRLKDRMLTAQAEVVRGPDHSQMTYQSGGFQGWKVIEQDGLVWRVDPQGRPREGQGAGEAGLGLGRPGMGLRVFQLRSTHLGGRPVQRYELRPPGLGKARVVLAVDTATHFPLATTRYSSQGRVLSSTTWVKADFGGPPPPRVTVPPVARPQGVARRVMKTRSAGEAELAQKLGGPLLKPARLPQGFSQTGTYLSQSPRGPLAEVRYSDGLRVVVLLQGEARTLARGRWPQARDRSRFSRPPSAGAHDNQTASWTRWRLGGGDRQGRSQAWQQALRSRLRGHLVRERKGDRFVLVAGDLSVPELQAIMDSIPSPPSLQPRSRRTTRF